MVGAVLGCLCSNGRIVIPGSGGGPSWPLVVIWGIQLLVLVGVGAFLLVRRHRRRRTAIRSALAISDLPRRLDAGD